MSSLSIEERFTVQAPPSWVWTFLVDPEKVVTCLPGAELTGQRDDDTYEGTISVSLGAVTVGYRGTVTFDEIDEERRLVRIVGRGREKSGSGTVSMSMESRVDEDAGGGAAVSVSADVKVAGKIVRFGRGMIESVSAEMIHEFAKRLEDRVATGPAPDPTDSPPGAGGDDGTGVERSPSAPAEGAEASTSTAERDPEGDGADAGSLPLLPLLWRSFKRWLRGVFR